MPMLRIETSAALDEEKAKSLALKGSSLVAKALGKPEQYVMTSVTRSMAMSIAGNVTVPCAFCTVRSIGGLSPEKCRSLSADICALVCGELSVPAECIYLNFAEVDASAWGWDGTTFG